MNILNLQFGGSFGLVFLGCAGLFGLFFAVNMLRLMPFRWTKHNAAVFTPLLAGMLGSLMFLGGCSENGGSGNPIYTEDWPEYNLDDLYPGFNPENPESQRDERLISGNLSNMSYYFFKPFTGKSLNIFFRGEIDAWCMERYMGDTTHCGEEYIWDGFTRYQVTRENKNRKPSFIFLTGNDIFNWGGFMESGGNTVSEISSRYKYQGIGGLTSEQIASRYENWGEWKYIDVEENFDFISWWVTGDSIFYSGKCSIYSWTTNNNFIYIYMMISKCESSSISTCYGDYMLLETYKYELSNNNNTLTLTRYNLSDNKYESPQTFQRRKIKIITSSPMWKADEIGNPYKTYERYNVY